MRNAVTNNRQELIRQVSEHALLEAASLIHVISRGEISIALLSDEIITLQDGPGLTHDSAESLLLVSQPLHGAVRGHAMLSIQLSCAGQLIRDLLGKCSGLSDLTEFEQEALIEIANILLNACVSNYVEIRRDRIESGMPRIDQGTWQDLSQSVFDESVDNKIFCLRINLRVASRACPVCLMFSQALFG